MSGEMNIICIDKVMSEGFCNRKRHHEPMCKYGNPGNHGLPSSGDSHEGTMGHKCAERVQGQISAAMTKQPKEFASDQTNNKKLLGVLHKGCQSRREKEAFRKGKKAFIFQEGKRIGLQKWLPKVFKFKSCRITQVTKFT